MFLTREDAEEAVSGWTDNNLRIEGREIPDEEYYGLLVYCTDAVKEETFLCQHGECPHGNNGRAVGWVHVPGPDNPHRPDCGESPAVVPRVLGRPGSRFHLPLPNSRPWALGTVANSLLTVAAPVRYLIAILLVLPSRLALVPSIPGP